jgi:3-deoxy-7-phosphoheptulonate synthase
MDIIVMRPGASARELRHIVKKLQAKGFESNVSKGTERTLVGVIGDTSKITEDESNAFASLPGVDKIHRIVEPFKLASRNFQSQNTTFRVGRHTIGGRRIHVMAGPCAVESMPLMLSIARDVRKAGATFIRGGAFKPRTSPYSFLSRGLLHILSREWEKRG